MAIRFNISDTHRWLKRNGLITFSESNLIDEIVLGTVGARNPKSQIVSKMDFHLRQLSNDLGYKDLDKLWRILKSLNSKYLIIREKSDFEGSEILGLNPYFWGQILIDKSHQQEHSRHLKCIVNNSKKSVNTPEAQPTKRPRSTDGSFASNRRIVGSSLPNRRLDTPFSQEIIEEKAPLESYRRVKKSLEGELDEIDLENLSPIWRKFAVLGGSS